MGEGQETRGATRRRRRNWLGLIGAVLLFLCAFAGMLFLQHQRLRRIAIYRPYVDSLFLPRVDTVRYMAIGYNLFAADFLYLRSIQAFGGQWRFGLTNYDSISHLFHVITELDPHFIEAYEFGSMVIGEEAGHPEEAIELNRKGWLKNSDNYRLAYMNAYTCLWTLNEPMRAKFWILQSLKAEDAPDFVGRFLQYIDEKQGRYESALEKNVYDYIDGIKQGADYLEALLSRKIKLVTEQWNLDILHKALGQYMEEHDGLLPPDVRTLIVDGYLDEYRVCYFDRLRALLGALPNPLPDDIADLHRRMMEASVGPFRGRLSAPYAENWYEDQYVLRVDVPEDQVGTFIEKREMILSMHGARKYVKERALSYVRLSVERFKENYRRYPFELDEMFPDGGLRVVDPVMGCWLYDSTTGQVFSPIFPDV